MNIRALAGVTILLASIGGGASWWYYTSNQSEDSLALEAPKSEVAFHRNVTAGTLAVTHAGGDALLDLDDRTARGCPEEWEPDVVSITVDTGPSDGWEQRSLWIARNGSGVGELPLEKGSSVVLAEPGAKAGGDILLDNPLRDGDEIRVIGQGGGNAVTFGRFVVER